jgi:hypothetical protein
VSPTALDFGGQALGTTSAAQSVVLTNNGGAALTISSVLATGDFAADNGCALAPATLAAGASCTIGVTFSPTGTGALSGILRIVDNASGSPRLVALAGSGL